MTVRVSVQPALLAWAIDRAGLSVNLLRGESVKDVRRWLTGEKEPTLKQLQDFAKKVHVPIGYLFLDTPPVERIPVPDYRTFDDNRPVRLSPNLIDTLHDVQRRQNWMRDYLIEIGMDSLPFVGSLKGWHCTEAAERIRQDLNLCIDWMFHCPDLETARRFLRNTIDNKGILISITGIVGLNTSRTLDPEEFCGFTLPDDYVPALFVNNNIAETSQMFTIAHELAHIWIGGGGVFNQSNFDLSDREGEKICNQIAAEFLVPKELFKNKWEKSYKEPQMFGSLAKDFKVSPIVIARRALDLNLINEDEFFKFLGSQKKDWSRDKNKKSREQGGNPYRNYRVRLGKKFSEAIISATRSGFLSYCDAFRLTGLHGATFDEYVARLQGGKLD